MLTEKFTGVHTAMVTPFSEGSIQYSELEQLIEYQIDEGIQGIVAVGTTGESPTLSKQEHIEVIAFCVSQASGKIPVMAGTGANSTAEAISLVQEADQAGADAHLQVAPYYNKPNQEGLYQHFSAIAEKTERPIILYSIPGRCGISIATDTIARLHERHPHICGLKEAGGNPQKIAETQQKLGSDFLTLSGDDNLTLACIDLGAQGVISVASNIYAKEMSAMVAHARAGNSQEARQIEQSLTPILSDLASLDTNPIPIKCAMHIKGLLSSDELRLPLCSLQPAQIEQVRSLLI